ncbi:hypothetical protein BX600DRAFT_39031 [Xylariales sp. PMI_506]|nr:hypothetical protein BX600DRAFT_39031 [Xylariales sp. PMI_506]
MAATQKSRPGRSDSLTRMLELERKCQVSSAPKMMPSRNTSGLQSALVDPAHHHPLTLRLPPIKMQRLQDSRPEPLTPSVPSSARPNSASKSRRKGSHPPLAHNNAHVMMVKTGQNDSGPSSLPLSTPPSPTSIWATNSKSSARSQRSHHGKEGTTKIVTFSEFEDDSDLSDQSSICQSPSWEGYNKKKKTKKKEVERKKKEESKDRQKEDGSKKKRLTKAPPPGRSTGNPLGSSRRSQSTSDLERHSGIFSKGTIRSGSQYPPDSMANHQNLLVAGPPYDPGKPKSRALFNGFRSQQGSAQLSLSSTRSSIDNAQTPRSSSSLSSHSQFAQTGRRDLDFLNPRKPPSVAATGAVLQPTSSSPQEPKDTSRKPAKSSHGRSNSFLARLKGPSYLYHKPTLEVEENAKTIVTTKEKPVTRLVVSPAPRDEKKQHRHVRSVSETANEESRIYPKGMMQKTQLPTSNNLNSSRDVKSSPSLSNQQQETRTTASFGATDKHIQSPHLHSSSRHELQDISLPLKTNSIQDGKSDQKYPHVKADGDMVAQLSSRFSTSGYDNYASPYTDAIKQLSVAHLVNRSGHQEAHSLGSSRPNSLDLEQDKINSSQDKSPKSSIILPNPIDIKSMAEQLRLNDPDNHQPDHQSELPQPGESLDRDSSSEISTDYLLSFISESYAPPCLELITSKEPSTDDLSLASIDTRELFPDEDEECNWILPPPRSKNRAHGTANTVFGAIPNAALTNSRPTSQSQKDEQPRYSSDGSVYQVEDRLARFGCVVPGSTDTVHSDNSGAFGALNSPTVREMGATLSQRSSSATSEDSPPLSSVVTTPDTSRPQSRRGISSMPADNIPGYGPVAQKVRETQPFWQSRTEDVDCGDKRSSSPIAQNQSTAFTISDELLATFSPLTTPMSSRFPESVREKCARGYQTTYSQRSSLGFGTSSATGQSTPTMKPTAIYSGAIGGRLSSNSLPSSTTCEWVTDVKPPQPLALKSARTSSGSDARDSTWALSRSSFMEEAHKTTQPTISGPPGQLSATTIGEMLLPNATDASSLKIGGNSVGKVLVICCSCKFFLDLPSRVYECMAKPDAIVEDKRLGVSAAITTMVKCPWCGHGMTTGCCSGYNAIVVLTEKLHGA